MAYTTINKSTDYFNTKLYSGNGSATQAITGVGHQPDLVWIKSRSNAESHMLSDAVRGSTKRLRSDTTNAEDDLGSNGIQSFNADGFTAGDGDAMNASGQTYASWNWLANGAGSANTDGDVTSTVSVNTTSGFSIVKWDSTGTAGINIGHGLGQKPAMIIAKSTNIGVTNWAVYHQSLGATKYLILNTTTASTTSATRWNNSEPTTTTFQTGSSGDIGGSDRTMIAYCFAEKTGYSKFGSYTGAGSNLPFIYTGFKPAFVMLKITSTSNNWNMFDDKRPGFNEINLRFFPNLNNAEQDGSAAVDFVSNGFKFRNTNDNYNTSGASYIYMAFAEAPLVGSNGVTAKAR